jgi:hypothetical protein
VEIVWKQPPPRGLRPGSRQVTVHLQH